MIKIETIQDIQTLINEYIYVIYDNDIIIEVDKNEVYFEDGSILFEDMNISDIVVYKKISESVLEDNLRDIIKQLESIKKDLFKFENGKSCTVLVRDEYYILNTEEIDELFSYYILEENITRLKVLKIKRME